MLKIANLAKLIIAINFAVALFALLGNRKKHSTSSWHCVVT